MAPAAVVIPYAPRRAFLPFHDRTARWAIIVAHRRAGKTVACVNDLLRAALTCRRPNGRYAYVAPTYVQAKDVAWMYVREFAGVVPGVAFNESELRAELPNGARLRLYGADNYDRMRGLYLDGVILDEVGDMAPQVFPEVIRPALSDREGWAAWIGTPKGDNHFRTIWDDTSRGPDWFRLELRASVTGILPAHELDAARLQMSPEQYAQEYECSFDAPVIGTFYAAEIEAAREAGRITRVPADPYLRVDTAWDLGMSDSTAIWFLQRAGGEIRAIDYLEGNGKSLKWYADALRERGHEYGTHHLPHDVAVRELGSGLSRRQTLAELGLDDGRLGQEIRVAPQHSVMDGVNAVRRLLPRMWFDEDRCRVGIKALRMYRRQFDDKRQVFRPTPLHDQHSHGADALRMYAVSWDGSPVDSRIRARDRYREERASTGNDDLGWMTV